MRTGAGDCWDHYAVVFTFPDGVVVDFSSTQYTKGYDDICCRVYGSLGTADTHYFGSVSIARFAAPAAAPSPARAGTFSVPARRLRS